MTRRPDELEIRMREIAKKDNPTLNGRNRLARAMRLAATRHYEGARNVTEEAFARGYERALEEILTEIEGKFIK